MTVCSAVNTLGEQEGTGMDSEEGPSTMNDSDKNSEDDTMKVIKFTIDVHLVKHATFLELAKLMNAKIDCKGDFKELDLLTHRHIRTLDVSTANGDGGQGNDASSSSADEEDLGPGSDEPDTEPNFPTLKATLKKKKPTNKERNAKKKHN